MTEITARDLLIPLDKYPHATESKTLAEAVDLLETRHIDFKGRTSMPRVLLVLDADNQLLGMVRRRDILRGLEPEFHGAMDTLHPEAHVKTEIDPNLSDLIPTLDPARLEQQLARPLGEVVIEMDARVNVDDSLMKIVREMVGKNTHIVAVLDEDKVVGIVRSLDVMMAISRLAG